MAALTAFYNNFEPHGSQLYMNGEYGMSIHCSFGDSGNLFGSPGFSWSGDAYASSSSGITSFFSDALISPLSNDLGQVVYPTEEEEDHLLQLGGDGSELFLQQLNGSCNINNQLSLVDTLKTTLVTPPESPEVAEVAERYVSFDHQEHNQIQYQSEREFFDEQLLADSPQMCASDESGITSHDVTVAVESELYVELEIKHEPPPLNMKRLEKIEEPDESIEAAEVSVDLIQNKRPFQCGLAGCNKTFKNPQTMKMHHKTHYTDGSAMISPDGVATLPTLTTSSVKAGQNKKIPSRCPKCRKTFVGLYELRRHYGRKHSEGEKPFGCRKCGKKFYIEVDVRDHEKLCGEPIECKCGLKFAFKCNLVAHKKAHPACQELPTLNRHHPTASNSTNNSSKSTTTTTSSGESTHSFRNKRHRVTSSAITSSYLETYCLPEAKAARYDFAGLEFFTEGSAIWGSNMHYSSVYGGLEQIAGHSQSFQPRKQEFAQSSLELLHLHPKFNALHDAMVGLN